MFGLNMKGVFDIVENKNKEKLHGLQTKYTSSAPIKSLVLKLNVLLLTKPYMTSLSNGYTVNIINNTSLHELDIHGTYYPRERHTGYYH